MNIGMPAPGYEFAIMDPATGKYCEPGVNGDLYVRGTRGVQLFYEYYKNPEAMEKSFSNVAGRWPSVAGRCGDTGATTAGTLRNEIAQAAARAVGADLHHCWARRHRRS